MSDVIGPGITRAPSETCSPQTDLSSASACLPSAISSPPEAHVGGCAGRYEEHAESRWELLLKQAPAAVSHALWKMSPEFLEERHMLNMQLKAAQTEEERANKVIPRAFFMLSISAPISTTYRAPAHSITPQPHPAQGFMTSVAAVLRQRIRRRSARKKKAQEAAKKLLLAGCPICRSLSPAAQHQSG